MFGQRKHHYFLAVFSFFFFGPSAWPLSASPRNLPSDLNEIRVLLGRYERVKITGIDLVLNGNTLEGDGVLQARCRNGLVYDGSKGVKSLFITAHGNFLALNGRLYRGALRVYAQDSACVVVNQLDLEKYIAGLLNKEMLPSWPMEALKAQAVAARTYAVYQMHANRGQLFDLSSTTQDQVYDGFASETPKSNRAAEETRGAVLTWQHSPIKAFFHADCGGYTESPEAVWGEKYGYFRPVYCPYHRAGIDRKNWNLRTSLSQLDNALHKVAGLLPKNFRRLARVELGPQDQTGRRNDLHLSDQNGKMAIIPADAFRNAVGYTRLRSTAFALKTHGGAVDITGHGYGHGVGMCQIGAKAMAEDGRAFVDILHFYYPLAKLEQLQ